jgi:hypothetical protein
MMGGRGHLFYETLQAGGDIGIVPHTKDDKMFFFLGLTRPGQRFYIFFASF